MTAPRSWNGIRAEAIAVISGYSPSFRQVGEITQANHKAYCDRHGYRHIPRPFAEGQGSWPKADILADVFESEAIEFALWIDSDAVFTNPAIPITSLPVPKGIVWASDVNGPNAGVMLLANTPLVRQLLWAVRTTGRSIIGMREWHDQSAFRFFAKEHPYREIFEHVDQRRMNSYRNDLYGDGRPLEQGQWHPGDFILHMPGLGHEKRIAAFKQFSPICQSAEAPSTIVAGRGASFHNLANPQPAPDEKTIVLSNFEGLGDLLLLSTLAERYVKERGAKVYWFSGDRPPRNEQVKNLLLSNPYLSGYSDYAPNAGMVHAKAIGKAASQSRPAPFAIVEKIHGFEAPYSQTAKLYVEPKTRSDFKDAVIFDLTSFTQGFAFDKVQEYIRVVIKPRFSHLKWFTVRHKPGNGGANSYAVPGADILQVGSLEGYIEAIASCRAFVGLESGGHALASAVRGNAEYPEVLCLMSTRTFNGRVFVFPNVEQTVVKTGPNYWEPHWP